MNENSCDENVCGPAVDRAHQPAKFDLAHDEMNAFVGRINRRRIVEEEQYTGEDLKDEEKKADAAKIIPKGIFVFGNLLFFGELHEAREHKAGVKIRKNILEEFFHPSPFLK